MSKVIKASKAKQHAPYQINKHQPCPRPLSDPGQPSMKGSKGSSDTGASFQSTHSLFADDATETPPLQLSVTSITEITAATTDTRQPLPERSIPLPGAAKSDVLSKKALEPQSSGLPDKLKWGLNVPLHTKTRESPLGTARPLLQQPIPLKRDLRCRPEAPSLSSYAATPVSEYGAALLRGMGWRPEEEIEAQGQAESSSMSRSPVPVLKCLPRPERLGLGATQPAAVLRTHRPVERALGIEMTEEEEQRAVQMGAKRRRPENSIATTSNGPHKSFIGIDESLPRERRLVLERGARVLVEKGVHRDLVGQVVSVEGPSALVVRLTVSDQIVHVQRDQVRVVDDAFRPSLFKDRRKESDSPTWLSPGLKVKIVSKHSFKNGRFYNYRGVVVDVAGSACCTLRLVDSSSKGSLLHDVPQSALQTTIPRHSDPQKASVRYVHPKPSDPAWKDAPFRILQLQEHDHKAFIQWDEDHQVIFLADYDDICEFVE